MGENRERNIYRIVVFIVLAIGGVIAVWLFAQDGTGLGEQGIFQFFSEPAGQREPVE